MMQTSFLSVTTFDDKKHLHEAPVMGDDESVGGSQRAYRFWKGSNRFLLNGKLVLGSLNGALTAWLFIGLIIFCTFNFYFFVLPGIALEYYYLFGVSYLVLLVLFMVFYILTATVEPGYLPHSNLLRVPQALKTNNSTNREIIRRVSGLDFFNFDGVNYIDTNVLTEVVVKTVPKKENELVENNLASIHKSDCRTSNYSNAVSTKQQFSSDTFNVGKNEDNSDALEIDTQHSNLQKTEMSRQQDSEVMLNELTPEMKTLRLCAICQIFKLERTAHCSQCNSCVRVYDHHCNLANNCIGKRNYSFFIGLVVFGFLLNLCFVVGMVISKPNANEIKLIFYTIICAGLILECICAFGVCVFHLYLCIISGKTTKEFMNDSHIMRECSEDVDILLPSEGLVDFNKSLSSELVEILMRSN